MPFSQVRSGTRKFTYIFSHGGFKVWDSSGVAKWHFGTIVGMFKLASSLSFMSTRTWVLFLHIYFSVIVHCWLHAIARNSKGVRSIFYLNLFCYFERTLRPLMFSRPRILLGPRLVFRNAQETLSWGLEGCSILRWLHLRWLSGDRALALFVCINVTCGACSSSP